MEEEIAWQEKEIMALKAVQQNAATAISTESTVQTFAVSVSGGASTQKYITFTPSKPCTYIQLSVSGFHDQAMTNPLETQASFGGLGYILSSVTITAFQMSKSGNNFRMSVKFWKPSYGDVTVYLRATAIGEQQGTFTIS